MKRGVESDLREKGRPPPPPGQTDLKKRYDYYSDSSIGSINRIYPSTSSNIIAPTCISSIMYILYSSASSMDEVHNCTGGRRDFHLVGLSWGPL